MKSNYISNNHHDHLNKDGPPNQTHRNSRPSAGFLRLKQEIERSRKTNLSTPENIFRLRPSVDLQHQTFEKKQDATPYREAVCTLCEKTVALALDIPLASLQARTRCNADIALARQIAMYLCHTTFSLLLTEVGLHFGRDRTTVSYACALIEDKRDKPDFDLLLTQLESLLIDARHAMSICVEHGVDDSAAEGDSGESKTGSAKRRNRIFPEASA